MQSFWLKVKKEYILENLNELLSYLRNYPYNDPQALTTTDFTMTLSCMMELSTDLAHEFNNRRLDQDTSILPDTATTVRLIAATLLTAIKCGKETAPLVIRLASVIIASDSRLTATTDDALWNLLTISMAGHRMITPGFTWSDIDERNFSVSLFTHRFATARFEPDDSTAYYENHGLLTIPPHGEAKLFPTMNLGQLMRSHSSEEFIIANRIQIRIPQSESGANTDFREASHSINTLCQMQPAMRPTPQVTKLPCEPGQSHWVEVTKIMQYGPSSIFITAETTDRRYEKLSAHVKIETQARFRPAPERFRAEIKEGAILPAIISDEHGKLKFDITTAFEEFYRKYFAKKLPGQWVTAIYDSDYKSGQQWLTSDGARVGIDDSKLKALSADDRELLNGCIMDKTPLPLKIYREVPLTPLGQPFFIYAEPDFDHEIHDDESTDFTRPEADSSIIREFLNHCVEQYSANLPSGPENFRPITNEGIAAMGRLLWRELECFDLGSRQRLFRLSAAEMLMRLAGRERDCEFLALERQFLDRTVAFAGNRPFSPMSINPLNAEFPNAGLYGNIVNTLLRYRNPMEPGAEVAASGENSGNALSSQRIEALVNASNALTGIIGNAELNNIKKAIAHAIDVDDEYESILSERTYYGTENISLEFKQSAVFPPVNRRRFSDTAADPDTQKWAILKAVCAFLNSRTGGELLIGVNDGGYAEGLKNDIEYLFKTRKIQAPDTDHYIRYLEYLIDSAFTTFSGNSKEQSITSLNVTYIPETNPEGKEILHVHIRPYPHAAVKFINTPPAGYAESYVRRSGSSISVTDEMRHDIELYKS